MKRDLDLARQLLLDIENRGTDCSVSVLRSGTNHQSDEQVRHHLRLLIDAGLLKEIDRTSAGIPCVRLTHDGYELLELARSDARWHEAKFACKERIGGLSLSVIRGILLQWAVAATARQSRYQRAPISRRVRYDHALPRERAAYRVEPYRTTERLVERDYFEEDTLRSDAVRYDNARYDNARYDNARYDTVRYDNIGYDNVGYENVRCVNTRPEFDGFRDRPTRYGVDLDGDGRVDVAFDSTLPGYLI